MGLIEDPKHGFELEAGVIDETDKNQLMEALVWLSLATQKVERVRRNTVQTLVRSRGHVSEQASPLMQAKGHIDEAMATIASVSFGDVDVETAAALSSAEQSISENLETHERVKRELEELLDR